jgi:hypothetical protein
MSIHTGICHGPVDELISITVGEKLAWEVGAASAGTYTIDKPELFGGLKKEGGVGGVFEFFKGNYFQTMPERLAQRLGLTTATSPAYRGIASLFFTASGAGGFYWVANSPYLQAVQSRVRRKPVGLSEATAVINQTRPSGAIVKDVNPAHIIYECLTNTDWGMGASATSIDLVSFTTAAQTLFTEAFGLSMIWTKQTSIEAFVQEVLDHIEATFYINPRNGLMTLKLIRGDYTVGTLRQVNPNNADLTNFQRKLWGETTNEVVVTWTNPDNEEEETVTTQDLGNISVQGGIVTDSRNYYGVRNASLATKLGHRDLRVVSAPLQTCEGRLDRSFWDILPGEVVSIVWPEEGMNGVVMRVGTVDYGKPGDRYIRVTLMEDIFSLPTANYTEPVGTAWVDTSEHPRAVDFWNIFTLPYFLLKALTEPQYLAEATYPTVTSAVLAAQISLDTNEFELIDATTDEPIGTRSIVNRGTLFAALIAEVVSVNVRIFNPSDGATVQVGDFCIIGPHDESLHEFCLVVGVSVVGGNQFVDLQRGCLDTIPHAWSAGVEAWFVNANDTIDDDSDLQAGMTAEYWILPRTSFGLLDRADTDVKSAVLTDRPWLPTRPANVSVEGVFFDGLTPIDARALTQLNVDWSNRNRLTEDSVMLPWDSPTVTVEAGQTTTVAVYDLLGILITAHDGLTGTSFILPKTSFGTADYGFVKVTSKRAGLESLQGHKILVWAADNLGYGYNYGEDYGGP